MKKIFILLLISVNALAQNSGIVKYNLLLSASPEVLEADKKYGFVKNAIEAAKEMEYELDFNGSESTFKQVPNDKLDQEAAYMANVLGNVTYRSYINTLTKEILAQNFPDGNIERKDEFIVKEIPDYRWELSSESKKIGDYLCYKATLTTKPDGNYKTSQNIEAWYCPKLPFSFGPGKYFGLPGLILELRENDVVFGIKSISFNTSGTVSVIKPTKGKIVSVEEYRKIRNDRFEKLKSMAKE
jgi:GLPGLI family protein